MITEAELMAYLDGELASDRHAEVEHAVELDAELRKLMEDELAVRQVVGGAYAPVLEEDIPDRLMQNFAKPSKVIHLPVGATAVSLATRRKQWRWDLAVPMAASLAVGILLGPTLFQTSFGGGQDEVPELRPAVVAALDTQLVSQQDANAPVQIGVTFARQDGAVCRTYRTRLVEGLACREDDQWRAALLAPSQPERDSELRQASSASALIMTSVQELIAGEPMGSEQERAARDEGWVQVEVDDGI